MNSTSRAIQDELRAFALNAHPEVTEEQAKARYLNPEPVNYFRNAEIRRQQTPGSTTAQYQRELYIQERNRKESQENIYDNKFYPEARIKGIENKAAKIKAEYAAQEARQNGKLLGFLPAPSTVNAIAQGVRGVAQGDILALQQLANQQIAQREQMRRFQEQQQINTLEKEYQELLSRPEHMKPLPKQRYEIKQAKRKAKAAEEYQKLRRGKQR